MKQHLPLLATLGLTFGLTSCAKILESSFENAFRGDDDDDGYYSRPESRPDRAKAQKVIL